MRSRGLSLLILAFAFGASASADDKTGKQKRADELFEEGRKLMADQNVEGACAKFDEAIKLDPEAPGTMLNLGLCNEKQNKYKTALYWFRKAQARAAETGLGDYETAAKEHTRDLAGKVATIKISFNGTAPEGTKVKIDNQEISSADYLAAEVDPGAHTLVAGAPGYKIFTTEFSVSGRGGDTITVDLVQGDNSVVVDPGAGRRKAAIITASAGGALLVGSLVVSLVAKSRYGRCANNGMLKPTAERDSGCPSGDTAATNYANDNQELAQRWGTGLFIGGAVAVGIASYLYFTAPEKERVDRTVFVPAVGPDQVGFAVSGGF
jgi:hypothetical protein